jgi:hypothetical protein
MTELMEASWRAYPAALLSAAGVAMVLRGARHVTAARRAADPHRALSIARAFRLVIVGSACIGIGAGWAWGVGWLVGLSLIIGGEELLETSVVIQALKDGLRGNPTRTHLWNPPSTGTPSAP